MVCDGNFHPNMEPEEHLAAKSAGGRNRPWTPEEDALLGTKPDATLAAELHRGARPLRRRRLLLGIPVVALKAPAWTPAETSTLGTDSDEAIAARLGRTVAAVMFRRCQFKIPPFQPKQAVPVPAPTQPSGEGSAVAPVMAIAIISALNARRRILFR